MLVTVAISALESPGFSVSVRLMVVVSVVVGRKVMVSTLSRLRSRASLGILPGHPHTLTVSASHDGLMVNSV